MYNLQIFWDFFSAQRWRARVSSYKFSKRFACVNVLILMMMTMTVAMSAFTFFHFSQ